MKKERFEVKVETVRGEPVYEGTHEFSSIERAEQFAEKIQTITEPREGECTTQVTRKV